MKSQQIMIIISVVIAAAAGYLAYNYLSANKAPAAVATRHVLIANAEIPARVKITAAMLTTVDRSVTDVDQDVIADPKSAIGFLALTTIPKGAAISGSRIGKPDDAPLPVRLKPGMRALTIAIDSVRGVANLIEPGDHVDVIAVRSGNNNNGGVSIVNTCLHDVLVLAMGSTLEQQNNPASDGSAPASPAATVTLAVTPKQAELLTLADSVAQLRLALRPPGEKANRSADSFVIAPQAQAAAPAAAPVAAAPSAPTVVQRVVQAAPAATPKAAAHELIVTVIDGDHVVGSGH